MIKVTPLAVGHLKKLLSNRGKESKGIRISVKTRGCSGLSYTLEYVDEIVGDDELIRIDDISLYVDPKASFFLIGTEMDYEENNLESGFKFNNPNEKGRCGCGESFHV